MKIPFVDLHPQYLDVKQRVDESLARIIASSSFVGGNFVKEFEAALAQEEGRRFAVGAMGTETLMRRCRSLRCTYPVSSARFASGVERALAR